MSGKHKNLLIGFSCPSYALLSLIPISAFIILQSRYTHPKKHAIIALSFLLFLSCLSLKTRDYYQPPIITIPRGQGTISLIKCKKELVLIDPGYIGASSAAASWVTYTLIPEIIKQTGTLTIDHLIVLQLNSITLESLALLCTKITVKKLYMPWWTGILKGKGWYNYKNVQNALRDNGGERIPLKNSPITIGTINDQSLLLKPTGKLISYNNITYPAYCVDGAIDNHSFTIYAAKHTKMKRIS